jgi:RHS repeat-associated protein
VTLERETLNVFDDKHRLALAETRTAGTDRSPGELIRYQLANHLASSVLELDQDAQVISYEEYFPYGGTSYQAVRSGTEAPKRYRYTGKERDEQTGLYYYGARYYAPWLARWTAADPAGIKDSPNVYAYCRDNPVTLTDPDGQQSDGDLTGLGRTHDTPRQAATARTASAAAAPPKPTPAPQQPPPDSGNPGATAGQQATSQNAGPDASSPASTTPAASTSHDPDFPNAIYASVTQSLLGPKFGFLHAEFNLAGSLLFGPVGGFLNYQGSVRLGLGKGFDLGVVEGLGGGAPPGGPAGSGGLLGATLHGGWQKEGSAWGGAFWLSATNSFGGAQAFNPTVSLTGVVGHEPDPGDKGSTSFDLSPSVSWTSSGALNSGTTLPNMLVYGASAALTRNLADQRGTYLVEGYGYGVSGSGPTGAVRFGTGVGRSWNWRQDEGTPRSQANTFGLNVNYMFEHTLGPGRGIDTHLILFTGTLALGRRW